MADSSTATEKRLPASSSFGQASTWFRKRTGLLISGLEGYFLLMPFW
ncbi:MAG: hypothetical protein KJ772_02940 [Proteobacteria bacterium]|nr:hypothetical protein [Pseudomonadota bacterium]MBU4413101.1 hypothetical protein [Pseudomonadota bacterium]